MTSTSRTAHLTRGPVLARNTGWNLVGNITPLLVAVFCIPYLIRGLGTDRFGLLTLVWALIGYASLFDLGLGRALTQLVAKKLGAGEAFEVPALVWTSLFLLQVFSAIGTIAVLLFSSLLVRRVLNIPSSLHHEALISFYLLAFSIPMVIGTSGLRGFLEAHQRFELINALRIPMGIFTFVGPLLVLPFSQSLIPVVSVLVLGRLGGLVAHLIICFRVAPELRQGVVLHRDDVGALLRLGGWMTVTNLVGPLMVSLDRFVIGALVSVAAVAFYVTPYELITKLWLIPGALATVLFPAFSTSYVQDSSRLGVLSQRAIKCILLVLFPIVVLVIAFAKDGLTLWLGASFAQQSSHVLQWLALGVLFNCLAQIPFALLQGIGRPDLTAKLHLAELPAYLLALWWCVKLYGIQGAAIVWTVRAFVDAVLLFIVADRFCTSSPLLSWKTNLFSAVAVSALALAALPQTLVLKASFALVVVSTFAVTMWFVVFTSEDRNLVQSYF
jgi:O-antigen/teichoic acid export membrane protein